MYHNHNHCACLHNLMYCTICNVVYCTLCGQEWTSNVFNYYVGNDGTGFGVTTTKGLSTCTH